MPLCKWSKAYQTLRSTLSTAADSWQLSLLLFHPRSDEKNTTHKIKWVHLWNTNAPGDNKVKNGLPYKRKFSRGSNFRYFRERFENSKICLREKLYFKRKFRSWYWYDILLHTLSYLKSRSKSFGVITIDTNNL